MIFEVRNVLYICLKFLLMEKRVSNFTILNNEALNSTNYKIILQSELPLINVVPGQFTNVEIPGNKEVFLRRPFSIFDVDYSSNTLTILVKILGKGSKSLTEQKPGTTLSLIYPLGKGFTLPGNDEMILAVGGGSGLAPILNLVKYYRTNPEKSRIILGAKTKDDHVSGIESYTDYATVDFTTDDGSFGFKGMVTDHPVFDDIKAFDRIYACGPLPMMKAVATIAKRERIECEVSLENLMACGFGVCLCCIEPTIKGNLCICTEGPVFNIKELKW